MAERCIGRAPEAKATPSSRARALQPAPSRPGGHPLLLLQRQAGNRCVQRVVSLAQGGSLLQRQATPAPVSPTAVNFNFSGELHVPLCGSTPPPTATTNAPGATWTLEPDGASVDPASSIAANGRITLAPTQPVGTIKARATTAAGFFERSFQLVSQPTGIASTSIVSAAGGGNYGAVFDHVFVSADGNVASLANVAVGERFTNVPNPPGASHTIVAPLFPFGGNFTLQTATLTPTASNNWFLTAAGGLGGTLDTVTIGQAGINAGRFVQSASNPNPPQGLPAGFTLLQSLHWFCAERPAANRWTPFVTVAHTRTLRNVGGALSFVTTANGVEQVDAYAGPVAVSNLTASPASTPRSAAPAAGAAAAPPARTVLVHVDTLPATLSGAQALVWTIAGPALGCSVAADPTDARAAVLTIGRSAGTVTVQAADASGVNRARVSVVVT